MPTPYDILGVGPSASVVLIRRAYRQRVQRMHPDRAGNTPEVHAAFIELQNAYALLMNVGRRAVLDAQLRAAQPPPPPASSYAPSSASRSPPVSVPLAQGRPGDALRMPLRLTLKDAMRPEGVVVQINAGLAQTCPRCHGQRSDCPQCQGAGQIWAIRRFQARIPAGVPEGGVVRLASVGHMGPRFTRPGDVLLTIRWVDTGRWRWHDRLETWAVVRHDQRAQACRVRSPEGRWTTVRVPATARYGVWLRVPNLGLPLPQGGRGDAYLQLRKPWWKRIWRR